MEYQLPKEVQEIIQKVTEAGYQIYIVGGPVRDLLMGRPVKDWDFTTDAKPEEILKIFPEGFYDNKFGTVGIPLKTGDSEERSRREAATNEMSEDARRETELAGPVSQIMEITTMRKEGIYKDFRHPEEVAWTNKVEEDLARRDFTMNAIALSEKGLVDPFSGCQDIAAKLIRAVGDPNRRFREDALRLIRAVRFSAQLGFEIEEKTWRAVQQNSSLIREISLERVRDELFKILASLNPRLPSSDDKSPGGQAYAGIVKLREAGILQIILPELENTFGTVQEGPKHAREYDIGEHSLLTLKEIPSADPLVRLAALLHDIGKPGTMQTEENGNVTFYNHDLIGGKLVLKIADRFHLSKKQKDKLYRLVRWHLFTVDENQTDAAVRRFIKNVGLENIEDMMFLRIGDRLGGGTQRPVSWRMERLKKRIHQVLQKPFSITDLKINGKDVMETLSIPPGPKVGKILNELFQEVLEDASKNDREYLLNKLKSLK